MGLDRLATRRTTWGRVGLVAATTIVLVLGLATSAYLTVWRTTTALAENSVAHAPRSSRAWASLGLAKLTDGDVDSSERALRQSLALDMRNRRRHFVIAGNSDHLFEQISLTSDINPSGRDLYLPNRLLE